MKFHFMLPWYKQLFSLCPADHVSSSLPGSWLKNGVSLTRIDVKHLETRWIWQALSKSPKKTSAERRKNLFKKWTYVFLVSFWSRLPQGKFNYSLSPEVDLRNENTANALITSVLPKLPTNCNLLMESKRVGLLEKPTSVAELDLLISRIRIKRH